MSVRKPQPGDVLTDIEDQGDNVYPRYGWSIGVIGTDGERYDILWGFEDTRYAAGKAMRAVESALARRLTDRLTHPRKRAKPPT